MRAAIFHGPGDLRVQDVPEPRVIRGELKLRMRATATCGTDAKIYRHGHHRLTPPQIIGHELAGEIAEVGQDVGGWGVGDRVQVIAAVPCGACRYCGRGQMTVCANQTSMGYQYPGGFAEYMVVPAAVLTVQGVNPLPDEMTFAEASIAEPLACVMNAQDLAAVSGEDTVVVLGAGPIGCLHVRLAQARGAREVLLVDVNADRLASASHLVQPSRSIDASTSDVVRAVRDHTDGHGADVVITAAPTAQAQEQAIDMAAPRGRVSFFGGLPKDAPTISCNSNTVHYQELTLLGANGSSPDQNRRALDLIARGEVRVDDLITHRVPLAHVHEAIEAVMTGEAIKAVVEP